MKICQVASLYFPYFVGGGEIVVERISRELKERGDNIMILMAGKGDVFRIHNDVKVYEINPRNIYPPFDFYKKPSFLKPLWHIIDLFNVCSYYKIKKILKKERPDVIHVHNYKGLSPLLFKAATSLNIPIVFSAHGYSPVCIKGTLRRSKGICESPNIFCKIYVLFQRLLIKNNVDFLISPSNFTLSELKSRACFNGVKTCRLPNPIEIDQQAQPLEKGYDIIDVLYVGALSEDKGIFILLDAFKKIKDNKFRLHIVGKGSGELEVHKRILSDRRISFYGFLEGDDLIRLYKTANITVVPSTGYEVFGMAIIESFANSTPVIASNIGGIPEIVKHEYNGLLFEAGNLNELKELLESLNENILKKMEFNAFKTSKEYDVKKHVDILEKIYRTLKGDAI